MKFFFLLYILVLCLEFGETFFLFPEKQAIFLCLKVCPLYCSKRAKRDTGRYWEDSNSSYDWPFTNFHEEDHPYHFHHPYHVAHWIYCQPKTTTTPKPTTTTMATTTEEPTWICEVCQKKCGTQKS